MKLKTGATLNVGIPCLKARRAVSDFTALAIKREMFLSSDSSSQHLHPQQSECVMFQFCFSVFRYLISFRLLGLDSFPVFCALAMVRTVS